MKQKDFRNPFKFWGSYVGFVITFFVIPIMIAPITIKGVNFIKLPFHLIDVYYTLNQFIVFTIIIPVIGFLVGWLIHKDLID